ncbi:cadherin repeat domain-containing protein, partial [Enterovibrio norvegicus]|uniref:cadherin repeat domain-containing protein n=1 Tax=Enterovibrio norvegicus TaxID=188144 RepID=UPI0010565558
GGLFTINPSTGEVTVAGGLDYETATEHTITALATSTDGSTSSKTIVINVSDDKSEYSTSSVTDIDGVNSVVSENIALGSTVG